MKKLHRRPNRFDGSTLGLDLHLQFIQYSLIDQPGDEQVNDRIPNNRQSLLELIDRLESEHGPLQVVFEACGHFLWVFDLLTERLGRDRVHVAAPSKLNAIAQSQEKNDANDAWWLAYLLWDGRLPEAFVAEGALRDLRIATRELHHVTEDAADLKRQMRSHLYQLGMTLGSGSNWHSQVGHERIQKIVDEVRQTHGLRDQVKILKEQMPGCGERVAPTVMGELGDPRRFHSAKAYAKASGLTPGYRESGGRRSGKKKIARSGSTFVRWALTQAVMGCLRCQKGPGLAVKGWVNRLARRKGKKAAIVAAARKLAECIWRLFNLGEVFDLARAFGGPEMIRAGKKL